MYRPADYDPVSPIFLNPWSWNSVGPKYRGQSVTAPASGGWPASGRAFYVPVSLHQPYDLKRFWWCNGATVGTDSFQAAAYNDAFEQVVSCALTLSAGTASQVQYAGVSVAASPVTSLNGSSGQSTYATPSVTLRARPGYMYAVAVINSHASSANTVTVATTGGALSFTSRATTQFNGTLQRASLFTAVATTDITDTITVTIGGGQSASGCIVSVTAWTNVDTATNHGVVQTATGTGNSTTPLATLGAFGSANNATLGVHGNTTSATTPGTGFTEMHDVVGLANAIEVAYTSANDTSVDATITSGQWGSIAAEIKSLGTTAQLAPGRYYLALHGTGTTATVLRASSAPQVSHLGVYNESSLTAGLPLVATPTNANNTVLPLFGITSRATP
jgi:hypothetical protein